MQNQQITIDETEARMERMQLSHGRLIRVVSVFPKLEKAIPSGQAEGPHRPGL